MSDAREALETFVKQYGPNAGYAIRFPDLINDLIREVRSESATEIAGLGAELAQLRSRPHHLGCCVCNAYGEDGGTDE